MTEKATIEDIMTSIDKLKIVSRRAAMCLDRLIEPLNERLTPLNLVIRWSEYSYVISRLEDSGLRMSCEITLDDEMYIELMAMTEDGLVEHFKFWGF